MKKLIAFINKNDMLIITAIVIIVVFIGVFQETLIPQDNLWNFGNIYKLYSGELIYKDVNIIITPIFFLIGKFMLTIFGGTYFTFQLYGSIIMAMLYILIYKIYRTLNIKKTCSILFTSLTILISYGLLAYGTSYNTLGLVITLLGILYSLKNVKKHYKYNNIIQAIFIILIFLTMQKLGVRLFYLIHIIRIVCQ